VLQTRKVTFELMNMVSMTMMLGCVSYAAFMVEAVLLLLCVLRQLQLASAK
jgi:hypothetical protein